ncbi:MAG: hypothetical protein ACTSPM_06710 [Candidatus Heimdallarchaeota archaeon]
MDLIKEKLSIIPYLHQPSEIYSYDKNRVIIQDAIIEEDVRIFQTDIDPTKFWERRIIASDKVDFTSRKFFVEWNISHALGLIQKPVYCKLVAQNSNDCNPEISIEKLKSNNEIIHQQTVTVVDVEKIPLGNRNGLFSFVDNDYSDDSKIVMNVELDFGQTKTKQDFILYAKSLIEIHKRLFVEINELPNWNKIRFRVFEIIKNRFLSTVIEKGLKKPQYKTLIENNFSYFEEFFRKKVHQIINEVLSKRDNYKILLTENRQLLQTIENEYRPQMIVQQSSKALEMLVKTINTKIAHSNLTTLSDALSSIILSSLPIKEQLLKYFNEFLNFLIVF